MFQGNDTENVFDDDEVMSPLVHRRSSSTSLDRRNSERTGGNRCMCVFFLLLLGILAAGFQWQVQQLNVQLTAEESKMQDLRGTIQRQEDVIGRFNLSVTNSDVLHSLEQQKQALQYTQAKLEDDFSRVQDEVTTQLNQTLLDLRSMVAQAKQEIHDEVIKVRQEVEEYNRFTQDQFSMENSFMVYQIAGTFTLLSCLISMWHMTAHLRKLNQPFVQRKVLAILWMTPVYAVTSWFSLVFHPFEGGLAIVKDGYEAYIIYMFLSFCIAVLGKGDRGAVVELLARHADHLTPPFRLFWCCKRDAYDDNRALADAILLQCQGFAMQFVFLRPITTLAMVLLSHYDYYGGGDGPWDYRSPQFYIILVQNFSVFFAFAGLLKFYHAVDQDLAWCRPFAKFLCIKGVVFMTFWQGLAISVLAEMTDVGGKDADEWAKSAQNFLICLEMLLFSIAHFYCFPTEEWQDGYRARMSRGKFGDSLALGDFLSDLKLILRSSNNKKKKSKREPSEPTVYERDGEDGDMTVSTDTSVLTLDEEKGLKDKIKQSLGQVHDDPNAEEARRRLLSSEALASLSSFHSEDEYSFIDNNSSGSGKKDDRDEEVGAHLEDKTDVEGGDYDTFPHEAVQHNTSERDSEPTESTSLLASGDRLSGDDDEEEVIEKSENEELLRPSVFTNVARFGRPSSA